jgi:hypothetical protein
METITLHLKMERIAELITDKFFPFCRTNTRSSPTKVEGAFMIDVALLRKKKQGHITR